MNANKSREKYIENDISAQNKKLFKSYKDALQLFMLVGTIAVGFLNIWLANKLVPLEKNFAALAADVDNNLENIQEIKEDVGVIQSDIKLILGKL